MMPEVPNGSESPPTSQKSGPAVAGDPSVDGDATAVGIDRAPVKPSSQSIKLAVVGAHLEGLPLNFQLRDLGAMLVSRTHTSNEYRLYRLPDTVPPKPGLVREPGYAGAGIAIEIWALDAAAFGRFVDGIPAPLGIGKVALREGGEVSGFLCEGHAVTQAEDITHHGGWRDYLASLSAPSS